jgi:DNA-binding IclR family transcriptional regulator
MKSQLDAAIRDGYATTKDEMTVGASSIAVPIFDWNNKVIAAIGIVTQTGTHDLKKWVPALKVVATSLSRKLAASRKYQEKVETYPN